MTDGRGVPCSRGEVAPRTGRAFDRRGTRVFAFSRDSLRRRLASRRVGLVAIGTAALLFAASVFVVQSVVVAFATHSPLPQEDEWYSLTVFRSILTGRHVLADLYSQHNEHRILFPRLVMFADYLFFGGGGYFDVVVIFIVQALVVGLFWYLLARSRPGRGGLALGAMVALLLFSLRQSENFVWGFQVQFVGVFAAGCLSIATFVESLDARRPPMHRAAFAMVAFALSGIAAFSMSNGLLSGMVLVFVAVLARAPWRQVLAAVAVSTALVAAFASGYEMLGGDTLRAAWLEDPARVPLFAAAYLGTLIESDPREAVALGGCGLAAMTVIFARFALGRDRDSVRLALLGIALFTAGSAVLTALGRSSDGLDGAMASRYATGAASFWSAILICGWSLAGGARHRLPPRLAVASLGLVLLETVVAAQAPTVAVLEERAFRRNVIEDALDLGLVDEAALRAMDDDPAEVRDLVPMLSARNLSIFGSRTFHLVGRPLEEAGALDRQPCSGAFTAVADPALGPDGARIGGPGRIGRALAREGRIYVAAPDGTIRGLASVSDSGDGWRGYATAPVGMALRAFARLRSGRLCAIGTATVAS